MSDRTLHGVAQTLLAAWREGTASRQQEWLMERCFSELDYRVRRAVRNHERPCTCELCFTELERLGWSP